ncbi:MAG: AsnC family protein [Flavisolibacter sp.]|nr:AsnC family protein [Flavisolibacter sp.]
MLNIKKCGTIDEKIRYVYELTGFDDLFGINTYEVDGKEYKFGIDVWSDEIASKIGNYLLSLFLDRDYLQKEKVLKEKIESYTNEQEKEEFIYNSIDRIMSPITRHKNIYSTGQLKPSASICAYYHGFVSQQFNEPAFFEKEIDFDIYQKTELGAIAYRLKKFLEGYKRSSLNHEKSNYTDGNSRELSELDQKILKLCHQGKTQDAIAKEVFLSSPAVKLRLRTLREKYDCKTTAILLSYCIQKNLL